MVNIYYSIFETTINEMFWDNLIQTMPTDIQQRAARYRKKENQYQLVYGRLLLQAILHDLGFSHFRLTDIRYDTNQKPFWRTGIDFSIAHSGNVVACAVSTEGKIGLDIEWIQPIPIKDFHYILNDKDQLRLDAATKDLYDVFFAIWTIKEAVSKADGRGLSMNVQNIYIHQERATFEGEDWLYQALTLHPDYHCHYVTTKPVTPVVKLLTGDWLK